MLFWSAKKPRIVAQASSKSRVWKPEIHSHVTYKAEVVTSGRCFCLFLSSSSFHKESHNVTEKLEFRYIKILPWLKRWKEEKSILLLYGKLYIHRNMHSIYYLWIHKNKQKIISKKFGFAMCDIWQYILIPIRNEWAAEKI